MRSPLIVMCSGQSEGGTLFIHGVSSALIGNFFDKHSASSFPSLHANYANAVTDQGSLSSPTLGPPMTVFLILHIHGMYWTCILSRIVRQVYMSSDC